MSDTIVIQTTDDGVPTLYLPGLDEHYHSTKGALTEARHVYIDMALRARGKREISLLEVGFGTGLNAWLTLLEAQNQGLCIRYTAFELYPLDPEVADRLDYPARIAPQQAPAFARLHRCEWDRPVEIDLNFTLLKRHADLTRTPVEGLYDVVYFDAFAPEKQPEMWSEAIFRTLYDHLAPGGILTTYCAKGEIRRRLQAIGFTVERLPGPPHGKREILRASKPLGCLPE